MQVNLSPISAQSPLRRPLVAVVDDDLAVIRSLEFALDTEGYAVAAYSSARAYLEADLAVPDIGCLIVDYNLPGMSGIELVDLLERGGVRPPTVLIASNPDYRCRKWLSTSDVPLVEKPFLNEDLTTRIREALRLP
jgi:FixJ family two-component response regulator